MGAEWDRSVLPIYEAAARGKCVLLLKTLLTGNCRNECAYCAFRTGRNCQRITWETKKLAHVTMQLWKETKICGLFLSPSFSKDPDDLMELHLEVLRTLRKMRYTGYIHLRMMPRVSRHYMHTCMKILAARKNFKINRSTDVERVIDAKLARRIRRYVDLRDKKLTDF